MSEARSESDVLDAGISSLLNTCPFCGKVHWKIMRDNTTRAEWVECRSCGARGPKTVPGDAVESWNERATRHKPENTNEG